LQLTLWFRFCYSCDMASKRKTDVKEPEAKKAKAEEEEKAEFQEPDAPKDNRTILKSSIAFNAADTTLNVLSTWGGKVLTPITEGGMAFLLAGAKANVGQKNGRYMFEIKIVQIIATNQPGQRPRQTLRLGFSTSEAELILSTEPTGAFFDLDGLFSAGSAKSVYNGRVPIARDIVVAVVLNLDPKSPNHNTMALYKDGVRVTEPKQLPEQMHGKPLYPHLNFRSISLQVNMGLTPLKELPFKCRLLQGAAERDVMVAPSKEPKDGVYEVVMPVAFPDEGTFDWVDTFLEKNPTYVELSDRKIIDWATRSGLNIKGQPGQGSTSNDKPKPNFGIPSIDDLSVRKVLGSVAPLVPRNYVVMEVKANLMRDERGEILKRFAYPCFRKVAHVVMGEPKKGFVEKVQAILLDDKQQRADDEWKKRKELKDKQELMKKRAEEMKLKREALKTQDGASKKEGEDEMEDDEKKDVEVEEDEDEPPILELDEAEKKLKFRSTPLPDLDPKIFSTSFSKFSTPDDEEGFDLIRYEWTSEKDAKSYLRTWITNKKSTMRIEDLKPGDFFKKRAAEFAKLYKEWQEKQTAYMKTAKKDSDLSQDADIFMVENISNVNGGCPLFEHFSAQDWALVQLRFELYAMLVAFPKDADDDERKGILLDHLQFYYTKYYAKVFSVKAFNKATISEVLAMITDTVNLKDSVAIPMTSDDNLALDVFVRITEEQRRERQRRIDAGDETVRLRFNMALLPKVKLATVIVKGSS